MKGLFRAMKLSPAILLVLAVCTMQRPSSAQVRSSGQEVFAHNSVSKEGSDKRAPTLEDFLQFEAVTGDETTSLSPDGAYLAYQRRACDIWLISTTEGHPFQLTNGQVIGCVLVLHWSPDSQHLWMMSVSKAHSESVSGLSGKSWVWSRGSNKTTEFPVSEVPWYKSNPWMSNRELVLTLLPAVAGCDLPGDGACGVRRRCDKVSVSVLESGIAVDLQAREQAKLISIDVKNGKRGIIASAPIIEAANPSPDKQRIAVAVQVDVWQPAANDEISVTGGARFGIEVDELLPHVSRRKLLGMPAFYSPQISWSPDGATLLVHEGPEGSTDRLPSFLCDSSTLSCQSIESTAVAAGHFIWYGGHELLISTTETFDQRQAAERNAPRYMKLGADGRFHAFPTDPEVSFDQLLPLADGSGLIALLNGVVWKTDGFGHLKKQYPVLDSRPIGRIRSSFSDSPEAVESHLLLEVASDRGPGWYDLDLSSSQVSALDPPKPGAVPILFQSETGVTVFSVDDSTGTYVFVKWPKSKPMKVYEANTDLSNLRELRVTTFPYKSLRGEDLVAQLHLPLDYDKTKRYPTIVEVYLGDTYDAWPETLTRVENDSRITNAALLALHGYAVLIPSMPNMVAPQRSNWELHKTPSDPYSELMNGVSPAIDELVRLGVADPDRLGVLGHSFGGFSVYGLLSQTTRFKAAVAAAGPSDFISMYGTYAGEERYSCYPQERMFRYFNSEFGQTAFGGPPWKDAERYRRNSPITYVDRIQTPLMIIQGDRDFIPIEQGEEMFSGLYRQNKRAEFVRYWGEGHSIEDPANLRDMWKRIYAWFDEFVKPGKSDGEPHAQE
jgi:dipeptidyl aminopeptidase/acylaminoacyl peptidase